MAVLRFLAKEFHNELYFKRFTMIIIEKSSEGEKNGLEIMCLFSRHILKKNLEDLVTI